MGAKQSKRSVDISGKEGEGAGEVAAAGAGGEGRVEALADADALKPQLNGDAHIHDTEEKEKQLDSGTPENEKDATTEKENKEQEDEKEKESSPVTNGDSEQKENGDATPSPEDGKKPKKEKLKKKWSLRSISFSRKDKPKQEKKQKDEETKTNGEPEKLPEEAAETTPESERNDIAEEVKSETEPKEEKTPETPVTEPMTNGSSTPETPKEETIAADEPAIDNKLVERTESPKIEVEPEQLLLNGHSLEEPKSASSEEPAESETSKPEETPVEKPEPVPATEITVKNEVCVEKMPLIEPTPPPLPANPPPSSVVSFAATTMAPELTDASLANSADITSKTAPIDPPKPEVESNIQQTPNAEDISPKIENINTDSIENTTSKDIENTESDNKEHNDADLPQTVDTTEKNEVNINVPEVNINIPEVNDTPDVKSIVIETPVDIPTFELESPEIVVDEVESQEEINKDDSSNVDKDSTDEKVIIIPPEVNSESNDADVEPITEPKAEATENDIKEVQDENIKNKSKDIIETATIECNGTHDDNILNGGSELDEIVDKATEEAPASDSELQEPIIASDKIAELIPEMPSVPELNTELEASRDVAAN